MEKELESLNKIVNILSTMDQEERMRTIEYILDRFNLEVAEATFFVKRQIVRSKKTQESERADA